MLPKNNLQRLLYTEGLQEMLGLCGKLHIGASAYIDDRGGRTMDFSSEIRSLISKSMVPSISVYLPINVGVESGGARIVLKNLLREATDKLSGTM
ncbi:MAG: hypothetical protein Q8N36_02120, partial [bacterium]|nr:hypothetical protein [bacterium]